MESVEYCGDILHSYTLAMDFEPSRLPFNYCLRAEEERGATLITQLPPDPISEGVQNNHRAILKLWPLLAGTHDQESADDQ